CQTFGASGLFPQGTHCVFSNTTSGFRLWRTQRAGRGIRSPASPYDFGVVYRRLPVPSDTHTLVHLCTPGEWASAQESGFHRPASLAAEGFVHLSAPGQVHLPADRLFADRSDMVLLRLDPTRLDAPVRWEPGFPGDDPALRFPHLYGPLPVSAVVG